MSEPWGTIVVIAASIVLAVVALVILGTLLTVLAALLYRAWYFVFIEWPDSFRWWLASRKAAPLSTASREAISERTEL